jgi:polysaccharide biosynthesis protein PslJ
VSRQPVARVGVGNGRPLGSGDGVTALTVFVILLLGSPSQYVVGPLGAAGTPAQVLAMVMTIWWAGRKLARPFVASPERQPIRVAMLIFMSCGMVSYVVANIRPIVGPESRATDRGMLTMLAWLGVVLVASDQISSRTRLDTLLKRLVVAGAAVAALGLLQFFTGQAFTNFLKLPGLMVNSNLSGIGERGGLNRPSSTALSPIEFGVAVTMLLPLTMHYALNDRQMGLSRRWLPVALVALATPFSVSRSAIVCAVVGVGLMMPVMSARARVATILGGVTLLGVVFVAVPGMLGTLTGLFTGVGNDTSAASRTNSYAIAGEFISRSPILGRGFMTFLPEYRILDNQFLGTLIELGALGLAALLTLLATGVVVAWQVRRHTTDTATRQLAQALLASLAAGSASYLFFDAFSFPMVAGLTFLLLGSIAALRRLTRVRAGAVSTIGMAGRHLDTTNLPRLTPVVPRR